MPEPNLLPLNLNLFDVNQLQSDIPELPIVTRNNLMKKYNFSIRKASILVVIKFSEYQHFHKI